LKKTLFFSTKIYKSFGYQLNNHRMKTIIDSKTSMIFAKWIKPYSDYFISITGHSNLINLFQEKNADIGGECSGHYIFKENFCISDGLYAALRMISHLEENNISIEQALNLLPAIWSAQSQVIKCLEEDKQKIIDKIIYMLSRQGVTLDLNDGVKAYLNTGCWMIRPSRTEEILRICAEGWTQEGLESTQEHLNTILNSLDLI
jgi:phosphomannomutase